MINYTNIKILHAIVLLLALIGFSTTSYAQKKHFEHNLYIGLGGVTSTPFDDGSYAFRMGYGLNCHVSGHWSIMPGIGYRARFQIGDTDPGVYAYDCSYIDVPVLVQYHLMNNPRKSGLVVELGPVFSFLTSNATHYNDADPGDALNDKDVYRLFDLGLQPGVYYQLGRHWRLGVQGHIGLLDVIKKYSSVNESYHNHDLSIVANFHF